MQSAPWLIHVFPEARYDALETTFEKAEFRKEWAKAQHDEFLTKTSEQSHVRRETRIDTSKGCQNQTHLNHQAHTTYAALDEE